MLFYKYTKSPLTQHACCTRKLFLLCFCGVESFNTTAFLKAFGKNLRKVRQEKKLTQANLAFEAGMSESQIQRIEYGNHNFSIITLLTLAKALDVSTGYLLDFDY